MSALNDVRVAILVTDGFEESELSWPRNSLLELGAKVDIISPTKQRIRSWSDGDWSNDYDVDVLLTRARVDNYDALILPGGVMNADQLRIDSKVIAFVRHFLDTTMPVAAICHGPWTLINAGSIRGVKMTSWPSLKSDLENAGARWVDEAVVVDQGIITSRKADDLEQFGKAIIEQIKTIKEERAA